MRRPLNTERIINKLGEGEVLRSQGRATGQSIRALQVSAQMHDR